MLWQQGKPLRKPLPSSNDESFILKIFFLLLKYFQHSFCHFSSGLQSGLIRTFSESHKLWWQKNTLPKINTCFGFVGVFESVEEKVRKKQNKTVRTITHIHFQWEILTHTHSTPITQQTQYLTFHFSSRICLKE